MQYQKAPFYHTQDYESIFGYAWMMYKRYFLSLFIYSFVGILGIQALMSSFFSDTLSRVYEIAENPQADIGNILGNLALFMVVFFLIYGLLYLFLFNLVLGKTLTPEKSHLSFFMEAISKHYLPFLLLMAMIFVIFFVGTLAGLLLFIIGALFALLFLGAILFPAPAMMIVEEIKPLQVIPRCFTLVLKDFWRVLGFVVLFYTIIILFSLIFSAVSMAPFAGKFLHSVLGVANEVPEQASGVMQSMGNPAYLILNSFFNALILPLTPIFSVLVYFHIKAKEDQTITPTTNEVE